MRCPKAIPSLARIDAGLGKGLAPAQPLGGGDLPRRAGGARTLAKLKSTVLYFAPKSARSPRQADSRNVTARLHLTSDTGGRTLAHFEKYQAPALGNMCAHYERRPELERGYLRDNIDPERTALNYNLAPARASQVEFIQGRIAELGLKRAPRKDAVRMVDCVVTQPKSLDAGLGPAFFQACYAHMAEQFGPENVVSAYVHLDESQPHMHFAFVPVTQDGRLSAKSVLTRTMLKSFHTSLQQACEQELGVPVEVCLEEETRGDNAAKYVDLAEFQAATARLECLRQEAGCIEAEIQDLQPTAQTLADSLRTLSDGRAAIEREAGLRSDCEQLRSQAEGLEKRIRQVEISISGTRRHLEETGKRIERVRARLGDLKTAIKARLESIANRCHGYDRCVPDTLSKSTLAQARALKISVSRRWEPLRPGGGDSRAWRM